MGYSIRAGRKPVNVLLIRVLLKLNVVMAGKVQRNQRIEYGFC